MLGEGYLGKEEIRMIVYERLSNKYGWLPSEIQDQDADVIEGYLTIMALTNDPSKSEKRDLNG